MTEATFWAAAFAFWVRAFASCLKWITGAPSFVPLAFAAASAALVLCEIKSHS